MNAAHQGNTGSSSSSTNYIMSKDSTDYIGDFIYQNNRYSRYNWGNGYVAPLGNSYTYRFYFRDHQGNNRVVTTSIGAVKQTTHYYPDGVTHDKSTGQGEQVYKYNGKELDRMHGLDWYDYGAREYDPTIGQFISMDPLCEKYYNVSPYAYCAGNPVRYVDPDGRDWYQNNKTSYYTWFNGDAVRDGFTHVGGKGSLLGEFEPKINNILIDVYKKERGLYSEGSIVDITDPNKGAIIPSQLLKMNDFLDEFVFGYGPEISILTENHPYTKTLQTDDRILESQQKLQKGNTAIPGQITKVNRSWGPLDVLSTTSIAKQFVGSYTFDSYTSYDKNHLLNIIYDTKNSRSLFYHIPGTAYLNHSRNSILKPFANTYQFYIWKSRK